MSSATFHTYPDLLHSGDRLACTEWSYRHYGHFTISETIAATLRFEPEAVILRAVTASGSYRGLAPGGLG